MHDWNLDLNLVVLELEVDDVAIIHFELLSNWILLQNLELKEWNQVRLEFTIGNLHILHQSLVVNLLIIIEEHHDAHLIRAHTEVIPLAAVVSDSCLHFRKALI